MMSPDPQSHSMETPPCFIVGMSRSGTTGLAKSLNQHSEIVVFGESLFWGRLFVTPKANGQYTAAQVEALNRVMPSRLAMFIRDGSWKNIGSKPQLKALLEAELGPTQAPIAPRDYFLQLSQLLATAEGKRIAVEKTPHHIHYIDRILDHFPNAKFIVIHRDPYSFMLSYKHQGDRMKPEAKRAFHRAYHPIICALVWRGYAASVQKTRSLPQSSVLEIRYDQFQSKPEAVFAEIQDFLPVLQTEQLSSLQPIDTSSFQTNRQTQALNVSDRFWMNVLCRREIQQLGYFIEPQSWTGAGVMAIAQSIAQFPVALIYALRNLGRASRKGLQFSLPSHATRWLSSGLLK